MEYWPGVFELGASRVSNAYLVVGTPPTVVDTGPPGALPRLLDGIRRAGVRPEDVRRIVLTHNDVDHIGNARALQRISGAEVCAHLDDIVYIHGERSRPGIRRLIGATMGRGMLPPRVDRALHDADDLGGLIVVHLPGHTPGHIGLQRGAAFLAGDAVIGGRRLRATPNMLTWNQSLARASIARIATLDFDLLLPGHGTPVNDGPRRCLEMAADLSNRNA